MGLDTVELVMEFEQSFALEFPNQEVCRIACEQGYAKREQLTDDTSFVNDLGMN